MTVPPPKIQLPRIPPSVIARTELVRTLDWNDAEETSRAVLVCAPAGYGKTTLLALHAQRLKSEGRLVGWMTCDRHDADATLLWQAVLAALSSAVRHSPERAALADPFRSLTVPPTMERAFLAELTEAVEALDAPVTLVLDDVHEVTGSATLAGLTDFLRNLPDRLNLIIGSRRDPAIPLHRLRLEGRLREVRGKDLAFGRDEVDQVLQGHGVHLDDPDLTILCRRTEGWPAAVRLAALALAEEPDPGRFVAEFAGDDTAVAGYLVAEILSRQQDTLQQFLLDTCVADTLTGELAASLSGRSDAGAILDGLEQANALVQRLGRSGVWFRYHSLLRSYLLAELRRRDLSATRARHRQAALWFDNAGFAGAALEHAVAANDEALIGDLLSRHGIRLLLTGSGSLLRRAIVDSPPRVRDDPGVLLLASIAAFDADDRVSGDQALARFDIGPEHGAQLQRLQDAARLYQARLHGDTAALLDIGDDRAASATGRSVDEDVELLVLVNRAVLSITAGDPAHAMADLRAALELALIRGHHRLALDSMNQLTGVAIGLSDIKESQEWARRAADFAADHGWATSPKLTYSHLIAGWCSYLTLDLDEATRLVEMSIAVLQGGAVEPEAETAARSGAAVLAFDRYPRRREALRDMEMIWQGLHEFVPSPALTGFAQLAEMQMCLALGDRGRAAAVVARVDRLLPGSGDAAVVRALELLDHQHHDRARAVIAPILTDELKTVVVTTELTAWLVEAVATTHASMTELAHRALLAALAIGERSGVMRPFYDFGAPIRQLLLGAIGRAGHLENFLARLLSAWNDADTWRAANRGGAESADRGNPHATLTAPLTAREIEVLQDLPSLLTAEEIADQHQVSVNTVKTHLRSLYRKLGAPNRRDAVANARQLGLL